MENSCDLGLYGLGTMGRALALNILGRGFRLAAWSRSPERRAEFSASLGGELASPYIPQSLASLLSSLKRPRKLILILPPEAVDQAMVEILPLMEGGDILIDASASHFKDSLCRAALCSAKGLEYVDLGISGSAQDLRNGPVFMAGASPEAWAELAAILEPLAAKDLRGRPGAARLGLPGSGHFVRMAQGSVEYSGLELLAETYHMMRSFVHLSAEEMRTVYSDWNKSELASRLVGRTADILGVREGGGNSLVDLVLDSPGPVEGGAWSAEAVASFGLAVQSPLALLGVSICARNLSALKDERVVASALLGGPKPAATGERPVLLESLRKALLGASLISLVQAFILLRDGGRRGGLDLDLAGVARLWAASPSTGSALLESVEEAYVRDPALSSPFLDSGLKTLLDSALPGLRKVASKALEGGLPMPGLTSALGFYDSYRSTWLPANLIQALRDGLGGHGYERIDRPRGEIFHSEWK